MIMYNHVDNNYNYWSCLNKCLNKFTWISLRLKLILNNRKKNPESIACLSGVLRTPFLVKTVLSLHFFFIIIIFRKINFEPKQTFPSTA